MRSSCQDVFSSAVVVTGAVLAADRLSEACKCYRQLLSALSLGDRSGAGGWQTFMTIDLIEGRAAMVLALGLLFVLRLRPTAA